MPVLKFPRGAERPAEEKPRSEPDRGNPAVRDRRGACGNMGVMGAGLRPGGKPSDVPPYPYMLRAPHFYPDPIINSGFNAERIVMRGHSPQPTFTAICS
jgi:hypothetical protein